MMFHPRQVQWIDHFARDGVRVMVKAATGRATVWLPEMNSDERLRWRELLLDPVSPARGASDLAIAG